MAQKKKPTKRQATPRQTTGVPQIKRSIVHGAGPRKSRGVVGSTLSEGTRKAARAATKPRKVLGVPTFGSKVKDTEAAPVQHDVERAEKRRQAFSHAAFVGGIAIAIASVALVVFLVLSVSPVFTITTIDAHGSEHVSQDSIAKLAQVPAGATLLNVDQGQIEANVRKNPWVASITLEREYPSTLGIYVTERSVGAIVLMNSGNVAWYLGTDGVWIEPVSIERASGQTIEDAALSLANSMGCILITNVPATVQPVAGSASTDDIISAVMDYQSGFSSGFASQIVSYQANSVDSLSCLLSSGVEVSLGSPTNISAKETAATTILDQYAGKVTYINVRVPTKPAYRSVDSQNVGQGTGALGEGAASGSSSTGTSSAGATDASAANGSTDTEGSSSAASGIGSSDDSSDSAAGTDSTGTSSTTAATTAAGSAASSSTKSGTSGTSE